MTSHPKDFNEELIKVIQKNKNICKIVHLPVQSGSNEILRRMNRRYTREEYLEKLALLRKYIPSCAVSSDIMVGFPGETEEDFMQTFNLVKQADFSTSFTFVYSRRKGTKADLMEDQISEEVKKDRIMRLVELQNTLTRESAAPYLGKTIEILCEDFDKEKGLYLGRDEYGKMGYFKSDKNLIGEFVNLKITQTAGVSLLGEIID
jgi:tRNA-2-methylthio-N6-dimethylallyladenosine synthase